MGNVNQQDYKYTNEIQKVKKNAHQEALKKVVDDAYYNLMGNISQITIDLLEEIEQELIYESEIADESETAGAFIYNINILIEVMDTQKCKVDIEVLTAIKNILQNWIDQI